MIEYYEFVDVLIGDDVGKSNHIAVAIERNAKKLLDRAPPQAEAKSRAIIKAVSRDGAVLLVVDRPPS